MAVDEKGWHDSLVAAALGLVSRAEDVDRLVVEYGEVLAVLDRCPARRGEPGCGNHHGHIERVFRLRAQRAFDRGDPLWRCWHALAERQRLVAATRRLELLEGLGDEPAARESPLLDALGTLPEEERLRVRRDVAAFAERLRSMLDAAGRGVAVAPLYRRPVAEQVAYEAERRERLGDPTAPVWRAWQAIADTDAALDGIGRDLGLE